MFIFPCFLPGLALNYIFENSFKPEAGARTGVSKIGILITDGKSQDDIIPPSRNLRESGVELFAIGMLFIVLFLPWGQTQPLKITCNARCTLLKAKRPERFLVLSPIMTSHLL